MLQMHLIDTKLYVPVVIFLIEDNTKLAKKLGDGFKCSVYWNKYKMIPNEKQELKDGLSNIRKLLDSSFQGAKRVFVPAYHDCDGNSTVKDDSHKRYYVE